MTVEQSHPAQTFFESPEEQCNENKARTVLESPDIHAESVPDSVIGEAPPDMVIQLNSDGTSSWESLRPEMAAKLAPQASK
ncbi:hypothetical protein H0H92_010663 [Tricholoma furcatifolium]|nr:hypothetical protein H0H92_010663 [Tricholoma furcatifolium]